MMDLSGKQEENSLLMNCPVCLRVMWRHGTCSHGRVPLPSPDAPVEPDPVERVAKRHTRRDQGGEGVGT